MNTLICILLRKVDLLTGARGDWFTVPPPLPNHPSTTLQPPASHPAARCPSATFTRFWEIRWLVLPSRAQSSRRRLDMQIGAKRALQLASGVVTEAAINSKSAQQRDRVESHLTILAILDMATLEANTKVTFPTQPPQTPIKTPFNSWNLSEGLWQVTSGANGRRKGKATHSHTHTPTHPQTQRLESPCG